MARDSDSPLLEQLIHNLIKKVDDYHEAMNIRLDNKVDNLETKVCDEIKLLRTDLSAVDANNDRKVEKLDTRLDDHEKRLSKIEHNWGTLTVLIGIGSTIISGLVGWVASLLGFKA